MSHGNVLCPYASTLDILPAYWVYRPKLAMGPLAAAALTTLYHEYISHRWLRHAMQVYVRTSKDVCMAARGWVPQNSAKIAGLA